MSDHARMPVSAHPGDGQAQGWLPIGTAPRDGTRVQLWLPEPWRETEAAAWYEPWGVWRTDRHIPLPADECLGIGANVPTHWMPLPQAPEDQK